MSLNRDCTVFIFTGGLISVGNFNLVSSSKIFAKSLSHPTYKLGWKFGCNDFAILLRNLKYLSRLNNLYDVSNFENGKKFMDK